MSRILFPELSYKIMGILFDVYNEFGPGYQEKHYQRAIRNRFTKENLFFQEQFKININKGTKVGAFYIDFLIENKIILEIKSRPRLAREHVLQVLRYLKETNIELGILATFSQKQLIYRRILRGY